MSAKREHLRRLQERILERGREMYQFSMWLAEEPPMRHWRKWHRWKKKKTGNQEVIGINCKSCGSMQMGVTDSRPKRNGMRWRRYRCWKCGNRQSTLEMDFEIADNLIKMMKIVEKITGAGK